MAEGHWQAFLGSPELSGLALVKKADRRCEFFSRRGGAWWSYSHEITSGIPVANFQQPPANF